MELHYDPDWVAADIGRPLSLSLPFNLQNLPIKGEKVANYFDNLLPDSDAIRRRVAERFRTGSIDPFELLRVIGRDCIGAVQILDGEEVPKGFDPEQPFSVVDSFTQEISTEKIPDAKFKVPEDYKAAPFDEVAKAIGPLPKS